MKILASSDLHLKKKYAQKIIETALKEDVDVIVNTGDFLSSEFANAFAQSIEKEGLRGYFIEGNWDTNITLTTTNVKMLRYTYERYKKYYFFGVYEKILLSYEDLLEITSHIPGDKLVFLTHEPPKGILDTIWNGKGIGNSIYIKFDKIKQPALHCFGHVHECNGYLKEKNTLFVNAALSDKPYCYIINLPTKEVKKISLK